MKPIGITVEEKKKPMIRTKSTTSPVMQHHTGASQIVCFSHPMKLLPGALIHSHVAVGCAGERSVASTSRTLVSLSAAMLDAPTDNNIKETSAKVIRSNGSSCSETDLYWLHMGCSVKRPRDTSSVIANILVFIRRLLIG